MVEKKKKSAVLASNNEPESKQAISLNKAAHDKILQWVFDGKLAPGAFMSQGELSKLLDIPTQPLRDALRVLESENMLIIHPRAGIQFRKPDLEFIRATYQFRSIIESSAASHFAQYGQETIIDSLINEHILLIEKVEKEGITPNILNDIEAIELKFHGTLISCLENEFVEVTATRLKYYIKLIQLEHHFTSNLVKRSLSEHIQILQACAKRDKEAASQALLLHFREALHRHMKLF
ncbi:GntR family transcriptional regulator [Shewanella sp. 10N.7]|uniref:GntR family transcriptional regulator n=1 Tax=Shewanella sp. 10N.7 TaxID=2885093 RepID=UPI001E3234CC|nr:GntR family transcriptional regulator [Shewanella sp. 10N.7]MCC4834267.1 GntR family transcriptional regulator [Shewanella sp. 10N.7]